MGYEVYGAREAGLNGRFCLRDPETKREYRDSTGRLYTYPDAVTAHAALPVAVKHVREAEAIAEPVEEIKSRIVSKAGK